MQATHTDSGRSRWKQLLREWRPNPRLLLTTIPIAIFYPLSITVSPSLAVAGGFTATAVVFYITRSSHLYQALLAAGFTVVAITAVIGIIWGSEKAYLASGACSNALFVFIYGGSVLIRHPLVGGITREVVPGLAGGLSATAPVFMWTTMAWAGFSVLQGIFRVYLLMHLSVGEYIIWSRVIGWPATGMLLAATAYFIWSAEQRDRRAREGREDQPAGLAATGEARSHGATRS